MSGPARPIHVPKAHVYAGVAEWTGARHGGTTSYDAYSRECTFAIDGKPVLHGSADVPFRGDPQLYNPEDLLLCALSTCHLLSYLAVCARAGIVVTAYRDAATGTMTFAGGRCVSPAFCCGRRSGWRPATRVARSRFTRAPTTSASSRTRSIFRFATKPRWSVIKKVVSVSLGSSSRDHRAQIDLLGERFDIERIGMDGSIDRALAKLRALDGTVDAIGLGGIDVYLYAGTSGTRCATDLRLLEAVKITPVVDGSGLKNTLEREAVRYLTDELGMTLAGKRVLMVSALDRFGMAQALVAAGADVIFGDFIFALDLDKPVHGLAEFEEIGAQVSARRV